MEKITSGHLNHFNLLQTNMCTKYYFYPHFKRGAGLGEGSQKFPLIDK